MRTVYALIVSLIAATVVAADASVLVVEIEPGIYFGMDLETGMPRTILFHRLDAPPQPPPITQSGLHVLIVDNENLRGDLPQAQLNIFTSEPLAAWLTANCAKTSDGKPAFRFSSNDAFVADAPARKLELKVWVDGWDAVMSAVGVKKVSLPAWAVTNGKKSVIEPLPATVDACLKRLAEFKQ